MRLRRHRPLGLLLVATAPVLSLAPPAGAADVVVAEVATWTRNPMASPPPQGGVAVANAPDGPVTISAIRLDVDDTVADGGTITLQLQQTDGVAPAGAAIMACPTSDPWESVVNGELADAPTAQCELGSVDLESTPEGSWSADMTTLLATGDSIVLVPATEAPLLSSLTFEPPRVSSRAAVPTTSGRGGTTPSASRPTPAAPASSFDGVPPPGPFSQPPSELSMPGPTAPPAPPAAEASAPPIVQPGVPAPAAVAQLSEAGDRARDLGQALRLALLSLACGILSVPIFRLKDGRHVPGLSTVLAVVRRRSTGGVAVAGFEAS